MTANFLDETNSVNPHDLLSYLGVTIKSLETLIFGPIVEAHCSWPIDQLHLSE